MAFSTRARAAATRARCLDPCVRKNAPAPATRTSTAAASPIASRFARRSAAAC
jgi:hypothetical protein